MITERLAAEAISFAAADECFRKFLFFIDLRLIDVGLVEFSHLLGVELMVCFLELSQTIDVLLRLDTIRSI